MPTTVHLHIHGGGDDPIAEILRLVRLVRTDLGRVLANQEIQMTTEADLDAALAQLSTDLSELSTSLSAAVARVEAALTAQGIDLTDEIAALNAASAGLDAATATLDSLAPEAPPTP